MALRLPLLLCSGKKKTEEVDGGGGDNVGRVLALCWVYFLNICIHKNVQNII